MLNDLCGLRENQRHEHFEVKSKNSCAIVELVRDAMSLRLCRRDRVCDQLACCWTRRESSAADWLLVFRHDVSPQMPQQLTSAARYRELELP